MSNLLACILACISVRDKHDEGIKKMCSTGISFGRSKLLQSCGNFTLKPELEPTVTACLADRGAQEVLYTGFAHTPTRVYGNSATLIDNIFINNPEDIVSSNIVSNTTDHFSQMCILTSLCKPLFLNNKTKVSDYASFNAKSFFDDLQNINWNNICKHTDANQSFSSF